MDFRQKLTASMQQSEAWLSFAGALQKVNESVIDPIISRAKSMTNVFEMHEDDVAILFKELGEVVSVGRTEVIDRPMLLQQRTDEVHFKGYMYSIEKTFNREFGDVSVHWVPLMAPRDTTTYPYPSVLSKGDLISPSDASNWFATSRAHVEVSFIDVVRSYSVYYFGIDIFTAFKSDLLRVIKPLIPTHIVFEGIEFVETTSMDLTTGIHTQVHAEIDCVIYVPTYEDPLIESIVSIHSQVHAEIEGVIYVNGN